MNSYQRDAEPFLILRDEEVSILRAGPAITTLRLTNWSADRSLLMPSFPLLTTLDPTTPLQPLHLALEPPLAAALRDWLTNPTNCPHVHAFEFTRQSELAVLAPLLTAHGNTPTALALPMLTAADAALVAAHACSRLELLRTEHPYAALPLGRTHIRHAAFTPGPALALVPREMRTRAPAADDVDGGTRAGAETGAAGGRLERLTVMLWHSHEEELEVVRALRLACARLAIRIEFERDVKAFRAVWAGVVQKRT
jgi:hypothetical protein